MKKLFLFAIIMLTSLSVNAQESGDSVKSKKIDKIKICKSKYEDSMKGEVDLSFRLNVGMNTMTGAPDDYSFKIWPSWDFGMAVTADWFPFGARNSWSIGLGVNWRKYRSGKDTYWVKGEGNAMMLTPYAEGLDHHKTTLHVFSLQVPVLYTHYFDDDQDWYVTLGALINFNTGAHTTSTFLKSITDFFNKQRCSWNGSSQAYLLVLCGSWFNYLTLHFYLLDVLKSFFQLGDLLVDERL